MSTFKSSEKVIAADRCTVYRRLLNPESFKGLAANVPENLKSQIGNITVEGDMITLEAKPVGNISFRVVNGVENERVRMETVSSPLPFGVDVYLSDDVPGSTRVYVAITMELNPIIKSMIAKPLQDAVEKLAELLTVIPYKDA